MPLILIGVGFALVASLAWALGSEVTAQKTSGSKPTIGAEPVRPPTAYAGDDVFALPQRRWGRVAYLSRADAGEYVYGVRFANGNAVVLREQEVVR